MPRCGDPWGANPEPAEADYRRREFDDWQTCEGCGLKAPDMREITDEDGNQINLCEDCRE